MKCPNKNCTGDIEDNSTGNLNLYGAKRGTIWQRSTCTKFCPEKLLFVQVAEDENNPNWIEVEKE